MDRLNPFGDIRHIDGQTDRGRDRKAEGETNKKGERKAKGETNKKEREREIVRKRQREKGDKKRKIDFPRMC